MVDSELAKIDTINSVSGNVTVTVASDTAGYGSTTGDSKTVKTDDPLYDTLASMKEGDRIVVTLLKGTLASVEPATSVTGKINTLNKTATSPNIILSAELDGETYAVARAQSSTVQDMVVDKDITLWVDSNGLIVDYEGVATLPNVVYVLSHEPEAGILNDKIVDIVNVAYADGTTGTLKMAKGTSDTGKTKISDYACYTVTPAAGGLTTFNRLADKAAPGSTGDLASADLTNGVAVTGLRSTSGGGNVGKIGAGDKRLTENVSGDGTTNYTNRYASDVKFVFIGRVNGTITVTGVSTGVTASDITTNRSHALLVEDASGAVVVKTMFIWGAPTSITANMDNLVYIPTGKDSTEKVVKDAEDKDCTIRIYNGYINGEPAKVKVYDDAINKKLLAGADDSKFWVMSPDARVDECYKLTEYNDANNTIQQVVSNNVVVPAKSGEKTLALGSDNSTWVSDIGITADTKFLDVRSDGEKAVSPLADTITLTNLLKSIADGNYSEVKVAALYDGNTGNAYAVYITSVAKTVSVYAQTSCNGLAEITGPFEAGGVKLTYTTVTSIQGEKFKFTLAPAAEGKANGDQTLNVSVLVDDVEIDGSFSAGGDVVVGSGKTVNIKNNNNTATPSADAVTFTSTNNLSSTASKIVVTVTFA